MSQLRHLSGELVPFLESNQELLPQSPRSTQPSLGGLTPSYLPDLGLYHSWELCPLNLIVLFLSSNLFPCSWGPG